MVPRRLRARIPRLEGSARQRVLAGRYDRSPIEGSACGRRARRLELASAASPVRRAQDLAVRERCDIGLSEILQTPEGHLRESIVRAGLMKAYAHRGEFLKHKFIVDIDGNSNSRRRPFAGDPILAECQGSSNKRAYRSSSFAV